MTIKVYTANALRKQEFIVTQPEATTALEDVNQQVEVPQNITGISHDGGDIYGLYYSSKEDVASFLTRTYDDTAVVYSLKVNLANNSIDTKIYYEGNTSEIKTSREVVGTGVYDKSDNITLYYPLEGDTFVNEPGSLGLLLATRGFIGETFDKEGNLLSTSNYVSS